MQENFVLISPDGGDIDIAKSFLILDISASEVSKYSEKFQTSTSCVVKTIEPRATAAVDDLKAVVMKINSLEREKSLPPWDDENIPEEIVCAKPDPG